MARRYDIEGAYFGDFKRMTEDELQAMSRAGLSTMQKVTATAKNELRQQMQAAGLAKIAKTWRSEVFGKAGTLRPAGFVWSKVPHIVAGFDKGAVIRARRGKYLAIPTEATPTRIGRQATTPQNWPSSMGKLRPVAANGKLFLVAEEVRVGKTGRLRAAKRTKRGRIGKGAVSVVVFHLVPFAKLKKRLNPQAVLDKGERSIPGILIQEIDREARRLEASKARRKAA